MNASTEEEEDSPWNERAKKRDLWPTLELYNDGRENPLKPQRNKTHFPYSFHSLFAFKLQ